jgi:hypothetical protein
MQPEKPEVSGPKSWEVISVHLRLGKFYTCVIEMDVVRF